MEIWKDVQGFEGFYQASNLGNIKSVKRIIKRRLKGNLLVKEKILNKRLNDSGYNTVWLCKDGKEYNKKVSRLVAINWKDNPELKPHVNHIDGNKLNDNKNNLEWCTPSENEKHAHRIGLKNYRFENNPRTKLKNKDVVLIRSLWKKKEKNQQEIGKMFGIKPCTVSKIVNNHNFTDL